MSFVCWHTLILSLTRYQTLINLFQSSIKHSSCNSHWNSLLWWCMRCLATEWHKYQGLVYFPHIHWLDESDRETPPMACVQLLFSQLQTYPYQQWPSSCTTPTWTILHYLLSHQEREGNLWLLLNHFTYFNCHHYKRHLDSLKLLPIREYSHDKYGELSIAIIHAIKKDSLNYNKSIRF